MTENEFQLKMNTSKYTGQGHSAMLKQAWKFAVNSNIEGMNESLCWAASVGHKDLIEFLLTSEVAKLNAEIHTQDDYLFSTSFVQKHNDILIFLINDMKIEKTTRIEEIMKQKTNEVVELLFYNRDKDNKSSLKIK